MNDENRLHLKRQVDTLRNRVKLIIWMQATGVTSLILCTFSMAAYLIEKETVGGYLFGISLILMMLSLVISLIEIAISGNALAIELEDIEKS